MLEAFKVSGKDKISKAVGKINTLIKELDDGIKQVNTDKAHKQAELEQQKKAWAKAEAKMNDDIKGLEAAADMGAKLKENIANLLK